MIIKYLFYLQQLPSSSQIINKIGIDQNNFQHRFFSLDVQFLVKKFLNHWKPETIIFVDSKFGQIIYWRYLKEKYL